VRAEGRVPTTSPACTGRGMGRPSRATSITIARCRAVGMLGGAQRNRDGANPRQRLPVAGAEVGVLTHDPLRPASSKVECAKMDQPGLNRLRVQDRAELVTLLTTLNGAMNALRRDECGDPTIFGARGHIRACDGTFHVYIACHSPKAWTYAKRQLAGFATVHQDGDDEGVLVLSRMPSEGEAETLRHYIGLRQTREVPPERAQKLRNHVTKGTYGPFHRLNPRPDAGSIKALGPNPQRLRICRPPSCTRWQHRQLRSLGPFLAGGPTG
jgi:hypothetical protein